MARAIKAGATYFVLLFGLGFLLDRRRDLLARIAAWSPLYLLVALGAGTWAYILAGGPNLTPMVDATTDKAIAAAVVAVAVYSSAFAAMGLCLRFLSGHSPVRRYLADASYWIYILHLPLVMLAQVWIQDWAGPWWLKLAGLSLGVTAVGERPAQGLAQLHGHGLGPERGEVAARGSLTSLRQHTPATEVPNHPAVAPQEGDEIRHRLDERIVDADRMFAWHGLMEGAMRPI